MVQSSDFGDANDPANGCWRHGPGERRISVQRELGVRMILLRHVQIEDVPKVSFVSDDDMV